jgi:hypothetical protein
LITISSPTEVAVRLGDDGAHRDASDLARVALRIVQEEVQ